MGEITKADAFGAAIARIVGEREYRFNLELGSWDGTGSTMCFVDGMIGMFGKKLLQCVEIDRDRFKTLELNTAPFPWVKAYNVSTIGKKDFLPKSFDEIWNSPHNNNRLGRQEFPRDLVETWYNADLPRLGGEGFLTSADVLPFYDAVLIDGSEFTGYSEFALLRDKTKCFFLDDVFHAYKCAQIYNELSVHPAWRLLEEGKDLRNGYAIFERR